MLHYSLEELASQNVGFPIQTRTQHRVASPLSRSRAASNRGCAVESREPLEVQSAAGHHRIGNTLFFWRDGVEVR